MRYLPLFAGVLFCSLPLFCQADPPAKDAPALAPERPKLSVIRLGETKDQILSLYGKPTKTVTLASGIESLSYQYGSVRLLVEISPTSRQVIQIYYFKATPFTGTQIGELLTRNAEGSRWRPNPTAEGTRFERFDGGFMRTNKIDDEYMLAFLSGSEVRGRNPAADAARDQEINESLKEIE